MEFYTKKVHKMICLRMVNREADIQMWQKYVLNKCMEWELSFKSQWEKFQKGRGFVFHYLLIEMKQVYLEQEKEFLQNRIKELKKEMFLHHSYPTKHME